MANSSTTVVVDSSTTSGTPAALGYGYVWATGKRAEYYELQNTGDDVLDFTRVGFWILGEGEWDGCHELWINDELIWTSEYDDPRQFHFHRGCDSPLGPTYASLGVGEQPFPFSSKGPDQNCDSFWQWFPSAVTPLCYSRLAYYGIFRKQWIQNPINDHQDDPTQWTDIAPVGLWRGLRVRIFDDAGNQTGYAFSTNPIWQLVDAKLRRKIFPEYSLDFVNGIEQLPAAVLARFNWGDIYASAQYCQEVIETGLGPRARFISNCAFNQQTTLAAIEEQILKVCRGYTREYAGKISYLVDQPRASVFTFDRTHILPGTLSPSDRAVSTQPNSYIAKFRDLLVPASATISGITCADHSNPVITTTAPHPYSFGDRIAIGGTNTLYDGVWQVASVPAGTNVVQLTLVSKGSNFPVGPVGAGGVIGLLYSRFKERAPTFNHLQNQYARGAVGVGIPRQLNPLPVTYDYATATFDQASRLARYEKDRALGFDVSPYVTPPALSFKCPEYAQDSAGSGACAKQVQPGDRVTLDDTVSYAYAGDYEVLTVSRSPYTAQASGSGDTVTLRAAPNGGQIEFALGPYNEGYMYDSTDPSSSGWSDVPGSDPGNDGDYTAIDLADGGVLAFISGSVSSGQTFDLPSAGFNPSNLIAWASPQGYIEYGDVMHVIAWCDVDTTTRVCKLQYEDGQGDVWGGGVNFAAATWIGDSTAAATGTDGLGITWLYATLDGGEQICFGCGVVPEGTIIELPAGFSWTDGSGNPKAFGLAFPHDASPDEPGASGNQAHGVGSSLDDTGLVHLYYQDGEGHVWHGNAKVMVFAWKNNSGLVTTENTGGANWMLYPSPAGFTLGIGMGTYADGTAMGLPAAAGAANSLQTIATPSAFNIVAHPAHGVGACYVDATLGVHCVFEDGEGNQWTGSADVFALFYEPTGTASSGAGGITVSVTPGGAQVPVGGTFQFSAAVVGTSNVAVNWSVDGIAGGNANIGTIDGTGLYTAPSTNGTHQITATSQVNANAWASQFIEVGTGSAGSTQSAVQVAVTPANVTVALGGTQQFTAAVSGTGTTGVTWSVDGVGGGNATVGAVSAAGLYTAPGASGYHTVTATSVADTAVAGSSSVVVGSGGSGGTAPGGGGGRPISILGG